MCRLVIPALVLFGLSFVSAATAQPDSSQSSVAPWDTYGQAFVSPGTQSGVDLVTITVADSSGNLLEGVFVEIDLSGHRDAGAGPVHGLVVAQPPAGEGAERAQLQGPVAVHHRATALDDGVYAALVELHVQTGQGDRALRRFTLGGACFVRVSARTCRLIGADRGFP